MGEVIYVDFKARKVVDADASTVRYPFLAEGTAAWVCDCGSEHFLLVDGGEIYCVACGHPSTLRHVTPEVG